jgi:hypothetical protein
MSFEEQLRERRAALLDRWRELVFAAYAPEAVRFFRNERDRFKNPVGHATLHATEVLFDSIVLGRSGAPVADALEGLVRIRAVQDFSASQAVAFTFQLKQALREGLPEAETEAAGRAALRELEDRIDSLAAMAFDAYVRCRESIHKIRLDEVKRRSALLFQRYGGLEPQGEAEPAESPADKPTALGGS